LNDEAGGVAGATGGGEGLRIAYLINQYPKVSHTFIRREIQALERQGIVVERFALRGWRDELADDDDRAERRRTRYVLQRALPVGAAVLATLLRAPARFAKAFAFAVRLGRRSDRPRIYHLIYLAEACRLALWMRAAGVRHLHAHFGTNSAEVAMLAHALGGPPYSFTVHGPEEFDRPEFLGLGEKIRRAAFVVGICSFTRSQLFRWVEREHWSKVHVVRCGLDRDFHDGPAAASASPRRLVCVGRLSEQKGHLLLLAAMRLAFDRGCSFELVLVGDGELRSAVEARVRALDLAADVRITGWVGSAAVRRELEQARALVLPSFAEGLPVVIKEAMALQRPVITTFVAGIPELVRAGESGWLVPAGDVTALADAIVDCFAADPATLQRMGESARRRVLAAHDIDEEAGKLARLFRDQVANSRRVPAC
jgi:colanic acid/amylovoran biosynthesis glycosyltransferase